MKSKMLPLLLIVLVALVSFRVWRTMTADKKIECHARIHTNFTSNQCSAKNVLDVFMSMIGGEGYFYVSGSRSCSTALLKQSSSIVKFSYTREGNYYALHLGPRSEDAVKLFSVLKDNDVRLKVTPLNNDDYIVSTPFETLMMCTND
ncbi:hypothetical protein [Enterobacter sp. CC120223-11]|uniref:hypothetical protein n=1 Tax=Enterobacter sp. CC120223-11 TaxID=1378073 RepID=UPI000BD16158|nr:hypothetical protein [Enterobacter sp. CC120223-11]SNY75301.1 hypothetical protein SAMN02744775_03327 [Enterobacter sp. CC120223-11]